MAATSELGQVRQERRAVQGEAGPWLVPWQSRALGLALGGCSELRWVMEHGGGALAYDPSEFAVAEFEHESQARGGAVFG